MNCNAPLLLLGLVALSALLRRVDGAGCGLHTYNHVFQHHNGEFYESCSGQVQTCKGGCSGYVQYKMHKQDTEQPKDHCSYGLDCCQSATKTVTVIDLINCVPLLPGDISQGPYTKSIDQATSCVCKDDCMIGGSVSECGALHDNIYS